MADKITAWSFSRYNCYMDCPRKAYYKFVLKLKEPGSAAMDRGTAIHKQAELYLLNGGRIPKELKLIAEQLKTLRKNGALAEANFIYTQKWEPTVWNDWHGAWCRIKADAIVPPIVDAEVPVVDVTDFKTGKVREGASEYQTQLELYCLAGLLSYPTAKKATSRLLFIDHGVEVPGEEALQKDVKKLQKKWEIMVKPMLNDTKFKPKPGRACQWCHFSKANGGKCEF